MGGSPVLLKDLQPNQIDKAETIINNYIGENAQVMIGSQIDASTNVGNLVVAGNIQSLHQALAKSGLAASDLTQLDEAITADGNKTIGERITGWVAENAEKVLVNGMKISADIGKTILIEYLKRFLGHP